MDIAQRTDRAIVFRTRSLGGKKTLALPTFDAEHVDAKSVDAVTAAASFIDKFDNGRDALEKAARTEEDYAGVEKFAGEQRAAAHAAITDAFAVVAGGSKATEAEREGLLTVRPLTAADTVTALYDHRVVEGFNRLTDEGKRALWGKLSSGEEPATLAALARGIGVDPVTIQARAVYANLAARTHAERLRELDARDEATGALLASLSALRSLLAY